MKLTFLGTGTSFGVPQIGCSCAVCRSTDPRDKRMRCAAVIESDGGTRILIDTPPELRLQLLASGVASIDALFITHDHADHTHGLDDIRSLTVRRSAMLPVYGPAEALAGLERKFAYVFDESIRPLPGTAKPEGRLVPVSAGERVRVGDIEIEAIEVPHGPVRVFGYRAGPIAYITDAKALPPKALEQLAGVRVLVLNSLRRTPHPTHLSIGEAVAIAQQLGVPRTLLTHLTHEISHADLSAELPNGVEPAYDNLTVIS